MMQLELAKNSFRPGEKIRGKLVWSLLATSIACEIRLIWFTEGKGTRDHCVVQVKPVELTKGDGSYNFTLTAPNWPHSFSGQFISLQWSIEVVQLPGEQAAQANLTISPEGSEIILPRLS